MDSRVQVIQGFLMLTVEIVVKVTNGKQQLTAESCSLILKQKYIEHFYYEV